MSEPQWYRELTPYQWRVLVCACLGWALDIMDGYLYAIILFPTQNPTDHEDAEDDDVYWRYRRRR
jgi:hypothetical protein